MRRGITLLELLVGFGLLAVLSAVVFSLFRLGSDQFRVGTMRNDLQSQAARSVALLRKELSRSSYPTVEVYNSPTNPARDGVTFATLSDWNDPSGFDGVGKPMWDRYYWFFSTDEAGVGRFGYAVVDPATIDPALPWPGFGGSMPISAPPSTGGEVTRVTLLSNRLAQLSIEDTGSHLQFDFIFEGQSLDARRRAERLQLSFRLKPVNN